MLRGTEWAATGQVTIPIPDDFPTASGRCPLPRGLFFTRAST